MGHWPYAALVCWPWLSSCCLPCQCCWLLSRPQEHSRVCKKRRFREWYCEIKIESNRQTPTCVEFVIESQAQPPRAGRASSELNRGLTIEVSGCTSCQKRQKAGIKSAASSGFFEPKSRLVPAQPPYKMSNFEVVIKLEASTTGLARSRLDCDLG